MNSSRILILAICTVTLATPVPLSAQDVCLTDAPFGKGIPVQTNPRKIRREIVVLPDGRRIVQEREELAIVNLASAWTPGQRIYVQFVDDDPDEDLVDKVIGNARKWESYLNLRFVFVDLDRSLDEYKIDKAHIRISFRGSGHWSRVGTNSTDEDNPNRPSMNLDLGSYSSDQEIRRVALHEFGHALGFYHEHQSPRGGINWKQPDAMDYYLEKTGWSRQRVQKNIFDPIDENEVTVSAFDRNSIMLYPIPPELTRDGFSVGWNTELSSTDINAAAAVYPSSVDSVGKARVRIAPSWLASGVMVVSLLDNSPYARLRQFGDNSQTWKLELGDVITQVNGKKVTGPRSYFDAVSNQNGRLVIRVRDIRTGKDMDFTAR